LPLEPRVALLLGREQLPSGLPLGVPLVFQFRAVSRRELPRRTKIELQEDLDLPAIEHTGADGGQIGAREQQEQVEPRLRADFVDESRHKLRLGELLRRMHDLGVLEKIVPAFAHARSLLQFNQYHKYTVDEHSIRSVECATEFQQDPGLLGEAYRGIRRKATLGSVAELHRWEKAIAEGKEYKVPATIDDPANFSEPWTLSMPLYRRIEPAAETFEFNCVEFAEPLLYGDFLMEPPGS
jgi:hypothetical protein